MHKPTKKLVLNSQTIRELTTEVIGRAFGGRDHIQSATDGATNCISEIAVCPTHDWSCINHSCTSSSLDQDPV